MTVHRLPVAFGNASAVVDSDPAARPLTRLTFMAHLRTFPILEMRDELRQADGTRCFSDWSALTHRPPPPHRQEKNWSR